MKLQREFLELKNYKMKLEILEIESRWKLQCSSYTAVIAAASGSNEIPVVCFLSPDGVIVSDKCMDTVNVNTGGVDE